MKDPMSPRLALMLALFAPLAWAGDDWGDDEWGDNWEEARISPWQRPSGFIELGAGYRLQSDGAGLPRQTLGEARGRFETGYRSDKIRGDLRADLRYDDVVEGWQLDIRELTIGFAAGDHTDIKVGRQVLTWGTGDFLFLNDLFPKDWQAFFSGLDDEYLKAPTNAIKVSYFGPGRANLDLAWIPRFESDNYLSGDRFSFYNPVIGGPVAPGLDVDEPSDDALAARIFGNAEVGNARTLEWAVYGYWGYGGQPEAVDSQGRPDFARLNSLGASMVLPLGAGLFNLEGAWYDYKDQDGDNPRQPADKLMLLAGYQQELITNLTLGVQYQLEHLRDYGQWRDVQPYPETLADQNRHLTTMRLDYRAMQEALVLSLFAFYSPSDEDFYLRPQASYRLDDNWSFAAGFNLLGGQEDHTFFGQLADNSNGWLRVRYSY
ncbi:hypothetical protein GCM10025772_00490 [Ferrimonas gelatinilytica]|uniref:Porin n=2 Tax=Ferrimonas gelatinilytica TaxID=1255257 RepID=A0ABP9RTZ2_9GAMM